MLHWDHQLETWVVAHRVAALNPVAKDLSLVGEYGAIWLAIALVAALLTRRWGVLLWVAIADAVAQLATTGIKAEIPRARPHVVTLVSEPTTHSFPSGHATSSFACAVVLSAFVPSCKLPFFVLAALIAVSRVYVGVHYPLDVIGGTVLGLLIGALTLGLRAVTTDRKSS